MIRLVLFSLFFINHSVSADKLNMGAVDGCAAYPPFIRKIGMQQPVAIDTAGLDRPGLKLREMSSGGRSYQKKGWSITGHAGATVRDRFGNIYVIPVPTVSLDTNPLEKRNIIYLSLIHI